MGQLGIDSSLLKFIHVRAAFWLPTLRLREGIVLPQRELDAVDITAKRPLGPIVLLELLHALLTLVECLVASLVGYSRDIALLAYLGYWIVEHCLTDDVDSLTGHFGSLVFEDLDHRFALVLEDLVFDVDTVSDDLLARHSCHLVVH